MTIILGDNLEVMRGMADDSVDLVFTSPPYEDARTYGIDFSARGQEWVDWCVPRFMECLRVSRGLVAWVVQGRTRQYRYSCAPVLLMADLHRAGVCLRNPPIFHRVGIPGSGGPDWLRSDYEWIVCATREQGRLPWSDNTAMGHPPKYGPGGAPSHRTTATRGSKNGDTRVERSVYSPPAKANPGNVVEPNLHSLSFSDTLHDYAKCTQADTSSILRELREAVDAQEIPEWWSGVFARVLQATILQQIMQGRVATAGKSGQWDGGQGAQAGEINGCEVEVRGVRNQSSPGGSPQGRQSSQQRTVEPGGSVHDMSPEGTQDRGMFYSGLREGVLRSRVLLDALPEIQKVWRSARQATESASSSTKASDVVPCVVGGGNMGSPLASLNEAPFPESLAEFFVRSFCPPGGTVLDPHSGSGTTIAVAERLGRKGIGIDVRESQVELSGRRLEEVK